MPRRAAVVTLVLVVGLTVVACGDEGPTAPSTPTATYSATDLVVGTGASAAAGNRITVHYTLWLYDPAQPESKGRQIETSRPGSGASFVIGVGAVIRGWDQGVPGMRVGGQRRLVLPPDLAYGDNPPQGSNIPRNASLVFDIELLGVN
jgi:FKBP-type peptidyl-prolyl cis-trans isomerase FkpA